MKNQRLRHKKLERNKKRRAKRKKLAKEELKEERQIRTMGFAKTGSIHGARKERKKLRQILLDKISNLREKIKWTEKNDKQ